MKLYNKPEIEITVISAEDIIMDSETAIAPKDYIETYYTGIQSVGTTDVSIFN